MGSFGRIAAVKDLPAKRVLAGYIKKAMALNEAGVKSPTRSKPRRTAPPRAPTYLLAALKTKTGALAQWKNLTPGAQREYLDWFADAKAEATRTRRLTDAVGWIAEGKRRNWKYENC